MIPVSMYLMTLRMQDHPSHPLVKSTTLTLRPKANLKKKFKMPFGILLPRACCRLTLYPLSTWSGNLVRHHITTHTRWFSSMETIACATLRCSELRPASKSLSNFCDNSFRIIVLSAISSPLSSTKGNWPFLERNFILWSTFYKNRKYQVYELQALLWIKYKIFYTSKSYFNCNNIINDSEIFLSWIRCTVSSSCLRVNDEYVVND